MNTPGVTILGLGPGDPRLLTLEAWSVLMESDEIYLRTSQHPVVPTLPAHLQVHSFDDLHEQAETSGDVYESIVSRLLELAHRPGGVLYGVPGHPFVAEATGAEIAVRASKEGLPVRVIAGLSFIEPVLAALKIHPLPQITIVDAIELGRLHVPPFPPNIPALIAQIDSKLLASDVRLVLNSVYPDEHLVILVHAAGTPQEKIEEISLLEIDRSKHVGLQTVLYVPPMGNGKAFEAFQEVVAHLRAPDGCPWDLEQTHQSLRSSLLEETYEVLSAIDAGVTVGLEEELGDLLLLILMLAQIGADAGEFTVNDVLEGINTKIVRRHPHVFGEVEISGPQEVLKNWERLKAEERVADGKHEAGALDSVSLILPALVQAEEFQSRAARVGFDWPDIQGVLDKLEEEILEVKQAQDQKERSAEIGDLLFAVVNLARWQQVDPESALREANARFRKRFAFIEAGARESGRQITQLSLDEMEVLWQSAKRNEKL
ncbi:MAG: nucleoside triphosphate pyrophosphohydrolase [Chloroflexi bacterium RBG_16_54_18]|nr:MAG: nucleoside triphosphate pyrophosphohydrolase [Chloroflexi bacterium RBG_16_54_18]